METRDGVNDERLSHEKKLAVEQTVQVDERRSLLLCSCSETRCTHAVRYPESPIRRKCIMKTTH